MGILIVSPLLKATGNLNTVQRIKNHFPVDFCEIKSCQELENYAENSCSRNTLNQVCKRNEYTHLIILHAFKCGRLLQCSCSGDCEKRALSYSVIFGGTDLNEDSKNLDKYEVIKRCIKNSIMCIAFTNDLKKKALKICNQANIKIQPQAVNINMGKNGMKNISFGINKNESETKVFLLLSGIRPVKDPLFVLEPFAKLAKLSGNSHKVKLMICGPVLDEKYFQKFNNSLENMVGPESNEMKFLEWLKNDRASCIKYFSPIPHSTIIQLLQSGVIFCLLNSSLSEGMCGSILEAMALNVPVLAKKIAGNQAIITDRINGMLFKNENDFITKALQLLNDDYLRASITSKAKVTVQRDFSMSNEKQFYLKHFYNI